MLISATAVSGAVTSGALSAVVDIAPNYAGSIKNKFNITQYNTSFEPHGIHRSSGKIMYTGALNFNLY